MSVRYVRRDPQGRIAASFANPQPGYAEEAIEETSPEYLAWLSPPVDLVAYAAAKRWEKETGGITLQNGLQVATDAVAQTKISAAKGAFDNGTITGSIDFKARNGWFAVDATAMSAVYAAVVAHVQSCYAKEKEVVDAIGATPPTITTTAEIDAAFAAV